VTDKNAVPHARLGGVLFELKDPDAAKEKANRIRAWEEKKIAAEFDANQLSPNAALAIMFNGKKDNAEAKRMFDQALLEPASVSKERRLASHLLAFQWAISVSDFAYAKKAVDGALAIDPDSIDANMNSAILARFNKQYDEAARKLDTLQAKNPQNFPIANNLVLVLIELSDPAKRRRAEELAANNVKLFGNNNNNNQQMTAEAIATYGWVAYKQNKMEDAAKAFQTLYSNNALNGDSAYYLAKFLEGVNKLDESKVFLDAVLKSPQVFFYRTEAEELLKTVEKKIAARPKDATPAANVPNVPAAGGNTPTATGKK
jgi:Tfp pilus assembly protein PilF